MRTAVALPDEPEVDDADDEEGNATDRSCPAIWGEALEGETSVYFNTRAWYVRPVFHSAPRRSMLRGWLDELYGKNVWQVKSPAKRLPESAFRLGDSERAEDEGFVTLVNQFCRLVKRLDHFLRQLVGKLVGLALYLDAHVELLVLKIHDGQRAQ